MRRLDGPCQHIQMWSRRFESLAMSIKSGYAQRFGRQQFAAALACAGFHFTGDRVVATGRGFPQCRCNREQLAEGAGERQQSGEAGRHRLLLRRSHTSTTF